MLTSSRLRYWDRKRAFFLLVLVMAGKDGIVKGLTFRKPSSDS